MLINTITKYVKEVSRKWFLGIPSVLLLIFAANMDVNAAQNQEFNQDESLLVQLIASQNISDNEMLISMRVVEMNLQDALDLLAEKFKVGISYKTEIMPDKKVSINMVNVPAYKVLFELLEGTNLEPMLPPSKDVIVIREKPALIETEEFQQTITGTVIDSQTGEALPGVNVVVEGTTIGAATNADGEFSLTIPDDAVNLVFSYIGYQRQVVAIGSQTEFDIRLVQSAAGLDEIVVTGYVEQARRDVTGSITSVDMRAIQSIPAGSAAQALQGQAAGVTILGAGLAGRRPDIFVRGISTFGDAQPLILVDGVEADLNDISAKDIQSIEVLRDAGAAAVYGVRGANGVIVVTTRKGQTGAPIFNYESYFGVTQPLGSNPLNLMNSEEFMSVHQQVFPNHPLFANGMPDYLYMTNTGATGVAFSGDPVVNPSLYYLDAVNQQDNYLIQAVDKQGTDWYSVVHSPAPTQNHSLSASGGTERATYLVGVNYLDQQGTMVNTRLQRYSGRVNTTFQIGENFQVGQNLNVYYRSNPTVPESQVLGSEFSPLAMHRLLIPVIPVYDIAGNYGGTGIGPDLGTQRNPLGWHDRMSEDRNQSWSTVGNLYARIGFLEDKLSFRSSIGGALNNRRSQNLNLPHPERSEFRNDPIRLSENWGFDYRVINTNTLTYRNLIGSHNFTVLGGVETIWEYGRNIGASRDDFFLTNFDYLILNVGTSNIQNSGSAFESTLFSVFTNVNYSFDNRYLFGFTLRRDGSSRFGEDSRYGVFPAVSLGWRISSERFMQDFHWLDDLRIRGSWGILGSQNNVNPANAFDLYAGDLNTTYYDISGSTNSVRQGFSQSRIGNPRTSWEENRVINVGLELAMFNSLTITADAYKKSIDGLLFSLPLPATVGDASRPAVNAGDIQNTGFDIVTKYRHQVSANTSFSVGLNFGAYRNEIVDLPGRDFFDSANGVRNQPGHPISAWFGYKVIGIYQDEADIANSASYPGAFPGRLKYEDINGDGQITADDRTFIGDPHPDFTYGILLDFFWRNFDISANIYGSQGNDVYNAMNSYTHHMGGYLTNVSRDLLNAWSPENRDSNIPILSSQGGLGSASSMSTYLIEDGSFLRLRSLMIGFTVPVNLLDHIGIRQLRLYAQATNLFTITGYSGLDPEVMTGTAGVASFGTDRGNYPNSERTFTFGLNLSF